MSAPKFFTKGLFHSFDFLAQINPLQGASEYQRKFAWSPSKKSASFQPSTDQAATPAGVTSSHQGNYQ